MAGRFVPFDKHIVDSEIAKLGAASAGDLAKLAFCMKRVEEVSYVDDLIAKGRAESEEFRRAYDEEVELFEKQKARREALMKRLAAVRRAKRLTQQQMADAMDISQARVSQLERGSETLSIDHLLTMLDVLGARLEIVSAPEKRKSRP